MTGLGVSPHHCDILAAIPLSRPADHRHAPRPLHPRASDHGRGAQDRQHRRKEGRAPLASTLPIEYVRAVVEHSGRDNNSRVWHPPPTDRRLLRSSRAVRISMIGYWPLTAGETMQPFRMAVHICFDAATVFLYTASIAIVIASVAAVYSQMLVPSLLIALTTFIVVAALWGRRICRRYRTGSLAEAA
jgi:hypothetical protein